LGGTKLWKVSVSAPGPQPRSQGIPIYSTVGPVKI